MLEKLESFDKEFSGNVITRDFNNFVLLVFKKGNLKKIYPMKTYVFGRKCNAEAREILSKKKKYKEEETVIYQDYREMISTHLYEVIYAKNIEPAVTTE